MKKRLFVIGAALIVLLVLTSFVSILTVQAQGLELKPPIDKTPGAMATEKAIEHATQGIGKGKQKENYQGTIAAVDSSSLTLTLKDGSSVTFVITSDTIIRIPTMGKSGSAADLFVGEQAHVRAMVSEGTLTALDINSIPGKPMKIHRVGIVTDYVPGVSITIKDKMGNLFTFMLTADTKILPKDRVDQLKVGSLVTIIAPRDVAGGKLIAAGIVVHPESKFQQPTETPTVTETPTPTATPTETPTETPTASPTP